jgi:aerotaxis receptor
MELKLSKDTMIVSETDTKGRILYVNDEFCKFARYTKDELIGISHNIVRHPDMPKEAFKDLWSTISSGNIWKGIVKNLSKDGSFYWVQATVFPSITSDGNKRFISVRTRVNDQELYEAQELYKRLK